MRINVLIAGGVVVGILDLLDAVVFFGVRNGVAPMRICQSIAAGLQGRAAFSGGAASAALGLLLHFFIAFVIVFLYALASRLLPILTQQLAICGALYGIGAYFFMNYVVIPLSATTRGAFAWPVFLNGIVIHIAGIGIPAAWFAWRAQTP
jgi:uncharacterized membrane protein YagU involved in acid resistance